MAGETENQNTDPVDTTVPIGGSMVLPQYNRLRSSPGKRPQGQDDLESLTDAINTGVIRFGAQAAWTVGQKGSRASMVSPNAFWGEALIDEDGYVVRGLYTIDADTAEQQLLKLSNDELKVWATQAKRTGFYGSSDPSDLILNNRGYANADVSAMANFMRYANNTGLVVRALLLQMSSWSNVSSGTGTTIKVTSPEDIRYYLDQAWLARFGRKPNKQDIDNAVSAIQQREREAAAQKQSSPSVAVMAQKQAEQKNKSEGAAYQLGNAIQLAFKYLGGG